MSTTTAGVRPHVGARGPRRRLAPSGWGTIATKLRRFRRWCWCPRCVLARTGIYRRSRTQTEHRIEIETRVLGIRIRRTVTPLTSG